METKIKIGDRVVVTPQEKTLNGSYDQDALNAKGIRGTVSWVGSLLSAGRRLIDVELDSAYVDGDGHTRKVDSFYESDLVLEKSFSERLSVGDTVMYTKRNEMDGLYSQTGTVIRTGENSSTVTFPMWEGGWDDDDTPNKHCWYCVNEDLEVLHGTKTQAEEEQKFDDSKKEGGWRKNGVTSRTGLFG